MFDIMIEMIIMMNENELPVSYNWIKNQLEYYNIDILDFLECITYELDNDHLLGTILTNIKKK
jgi:hypothetical protein